MENMQLMVIILNIKKKKKRMYQEEKISDKLLITRNLLVVSKTG